MSAFQDISSKRTEFFVDWIIEVPIHKGLLVSLLTVNLGRGSEFALSLISNAI